MTIRRNVLDLTLRIQQETLAASTRTVSASNIESVEVVTGIPSVEYGLPA